MSSNTLIDIFLQPSNLYNAGSSTPVPEFAQLCARLLGPAWEHVASVFAVGAVLGACIVYWVLMSTFLYDSVDFISGRSKIIP